jgi:nitrite reductase (NADH) small subunit
MRAGDVFRAEFDRVGPVTVRVVEVLVASKQPAGRAPRFGAEADARMSNEPGVMLVPLAEPRGRQAWTFKHHGRSYAVFTVDGELHVTDAGCPHRGGPLAQGLVRDGIVTCPRHWYSFELRSGECPTAAGYRLRKYPVVSRDGRPYAELPADARPRSWSRLLRPHARSRPAG